MIFNTRELQAIISSIESNFVAACAIHFERIREQVAKGETEVRYSDTATFRVFRSVAAEMVERMGEADSVDHESTKARKSREQDCQQRQPKAQSAETSSFDVAARVRRAEARPAERRPLQDEEKIADVDIRAPRMNAPLRTPQFFLRF